MPDLNSRGETPAQRAASWLDTFHKQTACRVADALDGKGTWEHARLTAHYADEKEHFLRAALAAEAQEAAMAPQEAGA